jgi:hypothetical protein
MSVLLRQALTRFRMKERTENFAARSDDEKIDLLSRLRDNLES